MSMQISYAVPDSTTSVFLVIADRLPDELAHPSCDIPRLTTAVWHARDSPLDPRRVWAYANWDRRIPAPSAYHLMVSATAPVRNQPRAAQAARAYARSLAGKTRGVLIDWATRDIVLAAGRPERARFHLGGQWLGYDLHVYDERHAGLPELEPWEEPPPRWKACAAIRIQTRGLARFGLPELVIDGIDCEHRLTALNVLRALAQHLLNEHLGVD
jgi:hypothetical protein